MPILAKLRRLLVSNFIDARPQTLLLLLLGYLLTSWLLLRLCGEADLTAWPDFIYWVLVTASTVGYGDLSPVTAGGKWVVGLFVIPLGLSIFALAIGRVAAFLSDQWRKGVRGLKTLDCEDHILVLGWNDNRTLHLLDLLLWESRQAGRPTPVALCVTDDIENPMPDTIEFVKATSYTDELTMSRANIENARCIIIDNDDDNSTLTSALYCSARNPDAHLIAYFHDESLAALLKQHCPGAECAPSVAVEMLAKSAFDPGSSALHYDLLNVEHGQAQYSVNYPEGIDPASVEDVFWLFKECYQATLIAIKHGAEPLVLNPPLSDRFFPAACCTTSPRRG